MEPNLTPLAISAANIIDIVLFKTANYRFISIFVAFILDSIGIICGNILKEMIHAVIHFTLAISTTFKKFLFL
jgi:hypothetical protein